MIKIDFEKILNSQYSGLHQWMHDRMCGYPYLHQIPEIDKRIAYLTEQMIELGLTREYLEGPGNEKVEWITSQWMLAVIFGWENGLGDPSFREKLRDLC